MSLRTVQQKWYLDKRDNWKYAIQLEECIVVEHRYALYALRWPGRDTMDMLVDWNNKKWKKFILIFPIFGLYCMKKMKTHLLLKLSINTGTMEFMTTRKPANLISWDPFKTNHTFHVFHVCYSCYWCYLIEVLFRKN